MKKLIAMLLCVVMVMGLAVTAFAAETTAPSIKTPDNGHTYEAYQIFTGDLVDGKLSNIAWGNGITDAGKAALGNAAAKAETLKTEADAKAFADEVAPYLTNPKELAANSTTSVAAGYYLIKDKDGSVSGNDTYTKYILEVVGQSEFNPKGDKPTVEKKVKDINDSTETTESAWKDSADHDIGDSVKFQLTGTLPSNYAEYQQYYYEFHDTLSAGLTYNKDAKVYVVNGDTKTEITAQCDMTGAISSVKIADLKKLNNVTITKDSKIVVEYTATLNVNAYVGPTGNPNEVSLEYSNNPNQKGDGTTKPSTGETPKDKVIVFTYELVVNKYHMVDGEKKALEGAGFTLEKWDADAGKYVAVGDEVKGDQMTTFQFKGLDDGKYRLVETTTPAGYNTIAPIEFVITATHTEGADPKLTELVVTPDDKFEVVMTEATDDKAAELTGVISTDVENKAGSTLPETGGMGTTLFYIVGSIMVVAAGVLLVTKKRMA